MAPHDPPKCVRVPAGHVVLWDPDSGDHYCVTCLNDPTPLEEPT